MSLPVSEEHFTFVIWSNEYLDWDNYRDAFEEDYSSLTDDEKYQLMCDLNNDYLDDERRNLDIQVGTPIIVIADVGRWDGRHTGYREMESGCIKDCLYSDTDMTEWYVDKYGDLRADAVHHDGTNHYLYRVFKDTVSPEQIERLQEKIYFGKATRADITKVTKRLGDEIAAVYGFHIPKQRTAAEKER